MCQRVDSTRVQGIRHALLFWDWPELLQQPKISRRDLKAMYSAANCETLDDVNCSCQHMTELNINSTCIAAPAAPPFAAAAPAPAPPPQHHRHSHQHRPAAPSLLIPSCSLSLLHDQSQQQNTRERASRSMHLNLVMLTVTFLGPRGALQSIQILVAVGFEL